MSLKYAHVSEPNEVYFVKKKRDQMAEELAKDAFLFYFLVFYYILLRKMI